MTEKQRKAQKEAIEYLMNEEGLTEQQAQERYNKWLEGREGFEEQVPLVERWANDSDPVGFSE